MRALTIAVAIVCVLLPLVAAAGDGLRRDISVDCQQEPPGPKLGRTDLLASPAGHLAFVEAASYPAEEKTGLLCVRSSKLMILRAGQLSFQVVHEIRPDEAPGHHFKLVDWSADGGQLLFQAYFWALHPHGSAALIFDAATDSVRTLDINGAVEHVSGRSCAAEFKLLGFDEEGRVLFRYLGEDFYQGDSDQPCLKVDSDWLLHPSEGPLVTRATPGQRPVSHGSWRKAK